MKKLLLISIGALLSMNIFAQDTKNLYLFEFEDESEYVGELISDSPDQVTVKRMDGSVVNIPAYKIIKRTKIDEGQWDENAQELIFSNLHDTRYFFSPTAFALESGEGYYNLGSSASTFGLFNDYGNAEEDQDILEAYYKDVIKEMPAIPNGIQTAIMLRYEF